MIEEEKKRQEEKGRARPRPVIIDGALEMAKSDGGKFAEFAERAASSRPLTVFDGTCTPTFSTW